jgi:hypothetical protein
MSGKATAVLMALSGAAIGLAIAAIQGRLFPVGPSPYGAVQLATVVLAAVGVVFWVVLFAFWSGRSIRESRERLTHLEEADRLYRR